MPIRSGPWPVGLGEGSLNRLEAATTWAQKLCSRSHWDAPVTAQLKEPSRDQRCDPSSAVVNCVRSHAWFSVRVFSGSYTPYRAWRGRRQSRALSQSEGGEGVDVCSLSLSQSVKEKVVDASTNTMPHAGTYSRRG